MRQVEVVKVCGSIWKLDSQENLGIIRVPEGNRLNHDTDNVQSKLINCLQKMNPPSEEIRDILKFHFLKDNNASKTREKTLCSVT